mmetsp:Transcript_37916/g.90715  ORF Transcript_37916/g.90715 Transcript_37916/m.90715 type:complete len:97 (+) Transcript_37916:194-484(+)
MTHVVSSSPPISLRLFMISSSVCESSEDVGSSQSNIGARLSMALARETRCFSPPDNFKPRSPTTVSYPSGNLFIISCRWAFFAALTTSSWLAARFP